MSRFSFVAILLILLAAPAAALADAAPFDLAGPALEVNVTRGATTLPISAVPSLAAGDKLAIKADLPAAQSARYLLVVAFLRGATDPPPASWFHRLDTWDKKAKAGLTLVVPGGAQQVLVLLAPATSGDFQTIVGAVQGRPGAFVRASQDLNQASLDRARLDAYLAAIRAADGADPDRLKEIAPLLARSLMVKVNEDCFAKMPTLQAPCLMQGQEQLVLDDGRSTSVVQQLTSGDPASLALELSSTPQARFGYDSSYVAAAMDIARLLDSLHTAQYQYIPALPIGRDDRLALYLNTPPSFHKPQSVLVTALPAVGATEPPALQPVDPAETDCAEGPQLLLPTDGGPLAFATDYARDMALRVKTKDGVSVDLPARADPSAGGFVVDAGRLAGADFAPKLEGVLHGDWGFQPFDGPRFKLRNEGTANWRLADADRDALVVGRTDTARLAGADASCVADVTLRLASGETRAAPWKALRKDEISVDLPLADAQEGPATLLVKQRGALTPEAIALQPLDAEAADRFALHAGDASGVLAGPRLDDVAGLMLAGATFAPSPSDPPGKDGLTLTTTDRTAAAKLAAGQPLPAKLELKDGRELGLIVVVAPARPSVALIGKNVTPAASGAPDAIQLSDPDALPLDAKLTFSVRAKSPATFSGHETIEVAAPESGASATLTAASGLTLEDPHVALASLDVGKALGASAFGPLQFRIADGDAKGDWQPLGTLVRLPRLADVKCRKGPAAPCELSGSGLYLIAAISADASFAHAQVVPEGFAADVIETPHPKAGRLYLKLRDDPSAPAEAAFAGDGQPALLAGQSAKPGG